MTEVIELKAKLYDMQEKLDKTSIAFNDFAVDVAQALGMDLEQDVTTETIIAAAHQSQLDVEAEVVETLDPELLVE